MGDSIDNIKGVPGIGEKGARDLIATYGSLDALLSHASEVSNKRYREGLLAHAEDARQSRELARIRTDVPVEFQSGDACAIAAHRANAASSCSRGSGSARSSWTTPPTRSRSARTTRSCERSTRCARLRRGCGRVGRFGLPRSAGRTVRDAGRDRRARLLDRSAARAVRAAHGAPPERGSVRIWLAPTAGDVSTWPGRARRAQRRVRRSRRSPRSVTT